jgi:hypothetical protein
MIQKVAVRPDFYRRAVDSVLAAVLRIEWLPELWAQHLVLCLGAHCAPAKDHR